MIPREKRLKYYTAFAIGLIGLVSALFIFALYYDQISLWIADIARELRDRVKFLEDVPLFYYTLAISILPIFMLPITPIFILAAARAQYGNLGEVLFFCWIGVSINIIISYFVARRFGEFIRGKLEKRGINVPEIPQTYQCELIFLLRMIPGNPISVQNYMLGLANVEFVKYIIVSIPIHMLHSFAYIYFGDGIFTGEVAPLVSGALFLAMLAIIARVLKRIYDKYEEKRNGLSKAK